MEQFSEYAYYYNSFYRDKDYAKEAKDIDYLLKKYGNSISNIISFGCGTGNHDVELSKLGYCCHGIDLSSSMIEVAIKNAKNENLNNTYEVADIRHYNAHDSYDAVISLFHVMSYQVDNDDIDNAIKSARKALVSGGMLLFDVWYGPGVLRDLPSVRIKEVEDDHNRMIRLCKPDIYENSNRVDVNYEILVIDKSSGIAKNINETHHMRYFFRPELEMILCQNGFKLIDTFDCKDLGNTSFESWTSYFLAKAI